MPDPAVSTFLSCPTAADWARRASRGSWRLSRHLALFNRISLKLASRQITRIAISAPPRHAKSSFFSRYLSSWWLGTFPNEQVIISSYGADLAFYWSARARADFEAHGPGAFGRRVYGRSRSGSAWGLEGCMGGVKAAGVGGAIMGRGANCLPAGTVVRTESGDIAIEKLVRHNNGTRVLSWDHSTNRVEWRSILASQVTYSEELVEITTTSGCTIRCTPNHRIYLNGIGYREASSIRVGDRLCSLQEESSLPLLRSAKGRPRADVWKVLPRAAANGGSTNLLMVPVHFRKAAASAPQTQLSGIHRHLLLQGVFGGPLCGQEQETVRTLRLARYRQDAQILSGLHFSSLRYSEENGSCCMSGVQCDVPAEITAHGLLWVPMCRRGPLQANDGIWQSTLQDWPFLLQIVRPDGGTDTGERQQELCRLRSDSIQGWASPIYPSHQRKHIRQPSGESRNPVLQLSCAPSQVGTDTVSVVRRLRTQSQPVYDIQVEGNGNFFADGILVHNCLIIDDPFKSYAEACSPTRRQAVWDWFETTAMTRLEPGAVVIIVTTRWHTNDLVGRLMESPSSEDSEAAYQPWVFLNLPALATEREPAWPEGLDRIKGDSLWPERFPRPALLAIKGTMSSRWWQALYQGGPTAEEGDIYEEGWFQVEEVVPPLARSVRFWDLAATESRGKEDPDWTVGALSGFDRDENFHICDIERLRGKPAAILKRMRLTAMRDGPAVPIVIEQEGGASGKIAIDLIIRHLKRKGLRQWRIHGQSTGGQAKIARTDPVAALAENGMLYLVRAPWNRALIEEHCLFPGGTHDDMVDAVSGGYAYLASKARPTAYRADHQANPNVYNYEPPTGGTGRGRRDQGYES